MSNKKQCKKDMSLLRTRAQCLSEIQQTFARNIVRNRWNDSEPHVAYKTVNASVIKIGHCFGKSQKP